jgi:membrane protein required for beta-lactamase induction
VELVRRSNHATAFAAWTVTTIAMGLVIQIDTLRSIVSFSTTLLVIGLLIPVLAATARTTVLLVSAGRGATVVGGEALGPTGAAADATLSAPSESARTEPAQPTAQQACDRLWSVIASAQSRDAQAHHALRWAYGSGIAFLAWSLLTVILSTSS